jgi:methionyl-tRNA formyltransferase
MSIRILFMGTPDFAVPILKTLVEEQYHVVGVVTQPDRPKGRRRRLSSPPVKEAAVEFGLPVLQPDRLRDPDAVQQILNLQPDLVVTAAYGQLLPEAILQQPKYGCINVHASLLPKYRGGAPIHWAIINGEEKTGISIMYMVKEMDAGDILSQQAIPITQQDHVGSLHDRLSQLGATMIKDLLPSLIKGEVTPVPQDHSQATYAYNIRPEDEWIDWSRTAEQIDCHIRGLHPWPVASTTWNQKRVKIWWAKPLSERSTERPGTILKMEKDGITVATGDGVIQITELQLEGKKRMSVADFLGGAKMKVGERFGDRR